MNAAPALPLSFAVVAPTLNAGPRWADWLRALAAQKTKPRRTLVIDSASDDDTASQAAAAGCELLHISRKDFDHGGTRQTALEMLSDVDLIVFLTQDALLADPDALRALLAVFSDPAVAAAYGRQLPRREAGPIERHVRAFNYPAADRVVSAADIPRLGLKAAFCSNSFAAYRRQALLAAGGFPARLILGEDMVAAGRLLLNGHKIAYTAQAHAVHSHGYGLAEEFRRYFDIGVLHADQAWLLERFGSASGEGLRFVKSEIGYLAKTMPLRIPEALLRTVLKLSAYRLGRVACFLPRPVGKWLSMHREYWNK
ncbi:MAG: glycosyltransferase family 2 protein [Candidatus Protistobacter heckmanni]|nr:glycosyltransferase family 2 protein [Candidatus Protistobacter heckmanni]